MIKKNKLLIVITMIFIILGMQISGVIAFSENSFFYTNKTEISQGETLEMTLDISKIKYDKFEFKLSSNLDTNNIIINEEVELENYNNDISLKLDKSKNNLNKITFYYQVPKTAQVGTKIELVAQIIVKTENQDEQTLLNTNIIDSENSANTIANSIETNSSESIEIENEDEVIENKKIEVEIIESQQSENQEKSYKQINQQDNSNLVEKNDKLNVNTQNNELQKTKGNLEATSSVNSNKSLQSNKVQKADYSTNPANSSGSKEETAVYNGSNNNYLASLEIEGETLNTTFNKENTTYFVKTTGKNELNIKAASEDNSAKVYITGNENLKTGDNKILISVTAENGDVRYYRVFVSNN